jgi:hypothetical protein
MRPEAEATSTHSPFVALRRDVRQFRVLTGDSPIIFLRYVRYAHQECVRGSTCGKLVI